MTLHSAARIAAVTGAVAAVGITLYAGRNSNLPLLMILMAGWVFAPFFGYALARKLSAHRSPAISAALDVAIVCIAIGSLAIYSYDAFGPSHARRATPYVAVPIASWLLMIVVASVAAWRARRQARPAGTVP